ncbi:hypothetical protein [Bifidobacterium oedipodis]|uniref:Uncharacterized protein n=1 Tax=Bifidobacterium oedipodis TaxID=2675322 RepID=A0A7Y0HSR7_9BIFI|nr:hypothetical protein [Bifidobacterium sp. DSM 109957]NMM93888.1 hypothetical protein [Bifidobacterium sp. DSM 109957]
MARCWYAAYWPQGVGMYYADDGTTPVCSVRVFDSMAARDAWVAADRFDQDWHRSVVSRAFAVPVMRGMLRDYRDSFDGGWNVGREYYAPGAVVAAYRALLAELDPYGVMLKDGGR